MNIFFKISSTIIIFWATSSFINYKEQYATPVFAISLNYSANSTFGTFAIVKVAGNRIVFTKQITLDQFLLYMSGTQLCEANTQLKNLFTENNIKYCQPYFDTIRSKKFCYDPETAKSKRCDDIKLKYAGFDCPLIQNLWRVRYKRNPVAADTRDDSGWAKLYYRPSPKQMEYLINRYHLKSFTDYIYGENLYRFLQDIGDSTWIEEYKNME